MSAMDRFREVLAAALCSGDRIGLGHEPCDQCSGMAEAAITALVAEMGLSEWDDAESCESEERDRDGQWHRCTLRGDHEGDHENEYLANWSREAWEPPSPTSYRIVTDWIEVTP